MSNPKTPTAIDKLVGMRIREARRAACLTQEQLGGKISLTFQQVQKYERGMNRVSAGTLHEIAGVFELPIGWFYDEEGADGEATLGEQDPGKLKACVEMLMEFRDKGRLGSAYEMLQCLRMAMHKPVSSEDGVRQPPVAVDQKAA